MAEEYGPVTGGCLCGEVRYRSKGEVRWVAHCHCRWCQQASGAAFLTYIGFRTDDLEWTKGAPASGVCGGGFAVADGDQLHAEEQAAAGQDSDDTRPIAIQALPSS